MRHASRVREITKEELTNFVDATPSLFHEMRIAYFVPLGIWLKQSGSFLLYHFGELFLKLVSKRLLYIEAKLRIVADYLHGRKIVMRKKGQSPFWDSMHEWKEEMQNGNGEKKE